MIFIAEVKRDGATLSAGMADCVELTFRTRDGAIVITVDALMIIHCQRVDGDGKELLAHTTSAEEILACAVNDADTEDQP